LVFEEKKVNVSCWGCKAEDFCLPGPSKPGCRHCDEVCAPCEAGAEADVCVRPKRFVWWEWAPGCSAGVHTRTKLMRKFVVRKIPAYKWVVEDLCDHCEAHCTCAEVPAGAEVPLPPKTDAKLKYRVAQPPTTAP
jgi:hypothetical protein